VTYLVTALDDDGSGVQCVFVRVAHKLDHAGRVLCHEVCVEVLAGKNNG
jgi:hypothetical protein